MSWGLREFLKRLEGTKPEAVDFPKTGTILEEQKFASVFDAKKRLYDERIRARVGRKVKFEKVDKTVEDSFADEMTRTSVEHTAAFHGIGSSYRITAQNVQAYHRMARTLRSLQQNCGADDPLVVTTARMFLGVDVALGIRSFKEEDLGFDVVTIPLTTPMPFMSNPNMQQLQDPRLLQQQSSNKDEKT